MKKRIMGLTAMLLAIAMVCIAPPIQAFADFYMGVVVDPDKEFEEYEFVYGYDSVYVEEDSAKVGDIVGDVVADANIPEYYEASKWKLWKVYSGGSVLSDKYTEMNLDDVITPEIYAQHIGDEYSTPILEAVITAKQFVVPVYLADGTFVENMVFTVENKDTITYPNIAANPDVWTFYYEYSDNNIGSDVFAEASRIWDVITTIQAGVGYDSAKAKVVASKAGSATVSMDDYVYGIDAMPAPEANSDTNKGKVEFVYINVNDTNESYTEVPTKAGEYEVVATFAADGIYGETIATDTFTVEEGELKITFSSDTYTKGQDEDFYAKCNGGLSYFSGKISMDGKEVDSKNYTVTEGSTIITFVDTYLMSLDAGEHTLKMYYVMGDVEASFEIVADTADSNEDDTDANEDDTDANEDDTDANEDDTDANEDDADANEDDADANEDDAEDNVIDEVPDTGDSSQLSVLVMMLLMSAVGMIVLKKKREA